jgi:putative ABC transport system ATP-binding protein
MIELIALEKVNKVYRRTAAERVALSGINLEIASGDFLSIIGPSGAGKSTLLSLIGLLDTPTSGTIRVDGRPVSGYPDRELTALRNRMFGFAFQRGHLVPELSAADNVELPLLCRSMSRRERRRLALAALERVNLGDRATHRPGQLSGGERRRVALARAIAGCPLVLLVDEPAGSLDPETAGAVMALLATLNQEEMTTVVMITHDPRQARGRVVRLVDGRQVDGSC